MKPPAAKTRPTTADMCRPFPLAYGPNDWLGHSGKASWYPDTVQFKVTGGQVPVGALSIRGGQTKLNPVKPKLMMDPSDPTTWQRQYRFTGGTLNG